MPLPDRLKTRLDAGLVNLLTDRLGKRIRIRPLANEDNSVALC